MSLPIFLFPLGLYRVSVNCGGLFLRPVDVQCLLQWRLLPHSHCAGYLLVIFCTLVPYWSMCYSSRCSPPPHTHIYTHLQCFEYNWNSLYVWIYRYIVALHYVFALYTGHNSDSADTCCANRPGTQPTWSLLHGWDDDNNILIIVNL
jgi:hypothetical protein